MSKLRSRITLYWKSNMGPMMFGRTLIEARIKKSIEPLAKRVISLRPAIGEDQPFFSGA